MLPTSRAGSSHALTLPKIAVVAAALALAAGGTAITFIAFGAHRPLSPGPSGSSVRTATESLAIPFEMEKADFSAVGQPVATVIGPTVTASSPSDVPKDI